MTNWIKRYVILTLCFVMVFIPLISVLNEFDVLKEEPGKTIFWIIFGVVVVAYYTIMTIMMINGDKKNLDSNKE